MFGFETRKQRLEREWNERFHRHPDVVHCKAVDDEWLPLEKAWKKFGWPKASRAVRWRKHCKGILLLSVLELRDEKGLL